MNDVEVEAVDDASQLVVAVAASLERVEVVVVRPGGAQIAQRIAVGAVVPTATRDLVGPPCEAKAVA